MKNIIIKKIIILSLALTVAIPSFTVNAMLILSKKETNNYIEKIAYRQMDKVQNPTHSSAGGEWTVMGLARAGKITSNYKNTYKKNLKKVLDENYGVLSTHNFTEYSRTVIALTSIGENPYDFYGYDVISPLAEYNNVARQGLNGVAYALIALQSGDYEVNPRSDYEGKVGSIEKYKETMIEAALPSGGWTILGKKADVDMTSIAIQALSPYYKKNSRVKRVVDEGLELISDRQKSNGGFESMGNENCESCSQVLTAISILGISIKEKRFVKDNHTVLDGLMKYYDDGAFKHIEKAKVNQMATDQAFYSLVAYRNSLADEPSIFNMKKTAVEKKYRKPGKKSRKYSVKKTIKKGEKKRNNKIYKDEKKDNNKIDNNIVTTSTKQENIKEKKNKEKKKIFNNNQSTTVNIVKEKPNNNKIKLEKETSYWWVWTIILIAGLITVSAIILKKRSK